MKKETKIKFKSVHPRGNGIEMPTYFVEIDGTEIGHVFKANLDGRWLNSLMHRRYKTRREATDWLRKAFNHVHQILHCPLCGKRSPMKDCNYSKDHWTLHCPGCSTYMNRMTTEEYINYRRQEALKKNPKNPRW